MSLPEGWRETTLGEVVTIKYGKDHKKLNDGKIPCLGSGGVMRYVDSVLYDKPSVLIPRKGTLSNLFYIDEKFWTVDTLFYTIVDEEKVLAKYLFFKLKVKNLAGMNVGSAVPSLTTSALNQLKINLPPLQEQKAIASMLSSFDEKIELLKAQNETLEQMAQGVFREWFVDGVDESWEVGTLGKIGKVVTGKTPSTKDETYWGNDIDFITPTDFKKYTKFTTYADRKLSNKGKEKVIKNFLPKGTILVTCIGSDMGKVAISNIESVTNQQINSLILKDIYMIEYVYQYLKSIHTYLRNIALGGSTMPIINKTSFEKIDIVLPPKNKLIEFSNLCDPINNKIINNINQIQTLQKTRDTLLPKLMSGELRVKGVKHG